ncbi:HET-domain-containing protein [Setomelanomma holmii]|uniref:HET-domain-containing protein n=1 Tax=Setomelanomma holmii TaxID=210430 RepID=A0A9P4H4Z5_9PLEO|nr:HET-domain-containing protein [Setomelanomma holmii]
MSTITPFPSGTLKDITNRSRNCSLCRLVVRSVAPEPCEMVLSLHEPRQELDSAVRSFNWEVDGREISKCQDDPSGPKEAHESARGCTRRIHVRWNNIHLKDSYLVYAAAENRLTASDAERAWKSSPLFLGREIGHRGSIQARIKSWIDLCQEKHHDACLKPEGHMLDAFYEMASHPYFGVIDVLSMQLTRIPNQGHSDLVKPPVYVALSYNAIDLVRRLGYQYLWVDALCIVQDDVTCWNLNVYQMDLIYGNAVLTICAADGPTASMGLLALDESTRVGSEDQHVEDCTPDVRLIVSRSPEMYERLLSRRCLIFTGNRVFLQCRSTAISEDIYADREGAGWSLNFMDAPLQTFRETPLRSVWVYMKSVENYTARDLSNPGDIVAAFSGVANFMTQTMKAPFMFGVLTSHLMPPYYGWSWTGWTGAPAQYRKEMIHNCLGNMNEWLHGNGNLRLLWDPNRWLTDISKHEE